MRKFVFASALLLAACANGDESAAEVAAAVPAEGTPMTSPAMTETTALTGEWLVEGDGSGCRVRLSGEDRPLAGGAAGVAMMAADLSGGCRELSVVRGWNAAPLGLYLADAGGMAVATFERTGPDVYRSTDQRFTLRRP